MYRAFVSGLFFLSRPEDDLCVVALHSLMSRLRDDPTVLLFHVVQARVLVALVTCVQFDPLWVCLTRLTVVQ